MTDDSPQSTATDLTVPATREAIPVWEARPIGRPPAFANPQELETSCMDYFRWVRENPLQGAELVKFQGQAKVAYTPKMRVMTVRGLCLFLHIDQQTWVNYRNREEFFGVCTRIEEAIAQQKFEGAAAELLNPAIIARDLGLRDHTQTEYSGDIGVRAASLSDQEIDSKLERLMAPMIDQAIAKALAKKGNGESQG